MHGCLIFLRIRFLLKFYGYLKLWVLKIVGTKSMAPQNFWGYSKFLVCVYSNLWVFKICMYMYSSFLGTQICGYTKLVGA